MRKLIAAVSVLLGSLAVSSVNAQSFDYHVYLNSDLRGATGCTVTAADGQSFSGIDQRLTATVAGSPPTVTELRLASCASGNFAAGMVIGGNYPVGLNNGVALGGGAFADVIELSLSRQQIAGALPMISIGFGAQDGAVIDDGVFTRNGLPGGSPMAIGTVQLIPTAGFVGLLLLGTLLLVIGGFAVRRNARLTRVMLISACLVFSAAAWAANFVLDGEVGDWSGIAPLATDQAGDAPLSGTDIVAAYAVDDDPDLRFRIDVVDAENRPPVAVDDAYTVLEDQTLTVAAPGVLANDSDPDGNTLSAQGFTTPNFGVVDAETDGSFTFAGLANENGTATFSYFAFDGQVASMTPAVVTVTVTPVNDVPVFVVGANQTVLEDAGAQSVSGWATSIDDGDPEVTQALSFEVLGTNNAALFSAGPAVSSTGTLTYTLAANANGSATIIPVQLRDDGGTANGGVDVSAPQNFAITVNAVNDAPSFVVGPNQTVNEDAGPQTITPWATAISSGPTNEAGQALVFNVTNNSNATLFSAPPTITAAGQLSYTPAANANGMASITIALMDDGGTANGGIDTSATQTFTITVNAINDAPSFAVGPNQVVNEDAGAQTITPWATAISDGDPEVTQGLSFQVTNNSNSALFTAGPTISPAGALSYTTATNANGAATITIQLVDDGGSANGGVDTSATQTFVITVNAVNDAPVYSVGPDQSVLEDAGPQVVTPWATAISPGPADESGQVVSFTVSNNSNPGLFSADPAVSPAGQLSYTPAANANGSATITLTMMDDGGTANGGVDASAPQTFTITVTPVNDEPSFTAGPNQVINEDAAAQVVSPWATGISAGPADESSQSLIFSVSNNNNALFLVQPAVNAAGVLSYTAAANLSGTATVTLNLMDDGGTANGGDDSSPPQTFTITVNAVNDAPVNTVPGAQSVDEEDLLAFSGGALISVADIDVGAGNLSVSLSANNGTLTVNAAGGAAVSNNGSAALQVQGNLADVNTTLASLTYRPDADFNGADTLSVTSDDNGNTGSGGPRNDADSVAITINPINDAPLNSVPGTQTVAGGVLTFSTGTGNALSVTDVDANPGNVQVDVSVTGGTLSAVVTPGATISNNGSAAVTLLGQQAAVNAALDGLVYTASGAGSDTLLMLSSDLGNSGAGGALTDSDSVTLLIDEPPTVTVTPINGATTESGPTVSLLFSESVDLQIGAVTITCAPSGAGFSLSAAAPGVPGFNVIGAPAVTGQPGDTCTITVISTLVTDTDLIDPPNELDGDNSGDSVDGDADNFVSTYSVDTAPAIVSSSPISGETVANNINLSVTFDEPVTVNASSFSLECPGGSAVAGGFVVSGSGTPTATINPTGDLPSGACVLTVIAANISDVDSFDPPQNPISNTAINFTVDAAPTFVSATPAAAAVVGTGQTVSFTFDENVTNLGSAIALDCGGAVAGSISGDGTPTLTFTPTSPLTEGANCAATAVAAQIGDSDVIDPPQNPVANVVRSFTVDVAPTVGTTVPANNATDVGISSNLIVNFSEAVTFTGAAFTLNCPTGSPIAFTVSGSGTNQATIDPTPATLPINTLCVLTIDASQIQDVDAADPPNAGTGITTVNFTTVNDNPPGVTASTPISGATVPNNQALSISFSEAINAAMGSVTLTCGGGNLITGGTTGSNVTGLTPTYAGSLPDGAACTLTVLANSITDVDAIDPPDALTADFVLNFSVDAAPAVISTVPATGASDVALASTITVNFSELVNIAAGGITLNCGGNIAFNGGVLPAGNVTTVTLTPSNPLPPTTACTGSVIGSSVTDVDTIDPPNEAANFSWSFSTVDVAPEVVSTTPVNGASDVIPTSNITINFSEPVNFDTTANVTNTSFDLECPSGSPANFTVMTASPASSVVLNPFDSGIAGSNCALIVRAAGITDADVIDPPNSMAADFNASFSFGALAEDDAYTVTPHLTLGIGTASPQGGGTLANDLIGSGSVTGFGFAPTCTGTAPGNLLDAGAANGRLTLNANGSFSYEPPAAIASTTRTFCYTVTGGDTANIAFTIQNTELLWFVNAAAAGGGTGTQARPFQTLSAAAAVDTPSDAIFLAFNASPYTGGITLAASELLIGDGSTLALVTDLGYTPVAGSAFPVPSGNAPTITCAGTCISLATGNSVFGLVIGDSSAGGTDLGGANFGTLTVRDLTLTGNGRALALTTGTLNGNFVDINATATNTEGLLLNAVNGNTTVTGQVNITNTGAAGIRIVNATAGASFSLVGGAQVDTANNTAVQLTDNLAATAINLGVVTLTGNTGMFISNSPVNLGGTTGTIASTGGPAIAATNANFGPGATLASVSSTNSGVEGISLVSVTGSLTMNGGALTNATGTTFAIGNATAGSGGSGNVTYAGTITDDLGTLLNIRNATGGTRLFSGAITDGNDGDGNGVSLTNNTGATINFSGGLVLSTGGNVAFNATGGGTISVTGSANTLATTTGTALNVANTNIGAADMTFRSISANGAVNGIVLNATGSAGGLVIAGNGGTCSSAATCTGGAIQNTTGDAISLTDTRDFAATRIFISNPGVNGLAAANILGTNSLSASRVENWANGSGRGLVFINSAGGSASFAVSGSLFDGTATGGDAILMEAQGASNMALSVDTSTFTDQFDDAIQVISITGASGVIGVNITNSTFNNAAANGNGGVAFAPFGGPSNWTINVVGNTFDTLMRPTTNLGLINLTSGDLDGSGPTVNATINNNTLNNILGSRGIALIADTFAGPLTALVEGNNINRLSSTTKHAINLGVRDNVTDARLTIRNNQIGQLAPLWVTGNGTAEAVLVQTQNAATARVLIEDNLIDANAALEVMRVRSINTSTLNATVRNNDLNDTNTTHIEFAAATGTGGAAGGSICLSLTGNIVPAAGVGVIQINENAAPGDIRVVQASAAAVSVANSNASVPVVGTPTFGVAACPLP